VFIPAVSATQAAVQRGQTTERDRLPQARQAQKAQAEARVTTIVENREMKRRHFLFLPSLLSAQQTSRREFSVAKFGALADGRTPDTEPIQKAIDTCTTQGGGTVRLPAGRYLCGSILLKNRVILHLDEGAVLLGSPNPLDYRSTDLFREGTGNELGYAFVSAVDATDIGVAGAGVIDGQGKEVLAALKSGERNRRPFLMRFVRCANVTLKDVRLRQSAVWTVHLSQCHNVSVERVNINSHAGSNNDGIDIDSCELVHVNECDIDTGDDAICLKTTSQLPCRDVTITNCRLRSNCATIKAGTESAGNFDNIRIAGCQLLDARLGGIKLLSVDGGILQNVDISDVTMHAGHIPIFLRLGARLKTFRPGDPKNDVGMLRNISIRGFKATAEGPGIVMSGIPGHRIQKVVIDDIDLHLAGGGTKEDADAVLPEGVDAYPEITMFGKHLPASLLYARHVEGLEITRLKTSFAQPDERPERVMIDAT
jgi:polygalacturonase